MDLKQDYPINNDNEPTPQGEGSGFKTKHYVTITVLVSLLAVLLTFIITYAVLTVKYSKEMSKINEDYVQRLDAIGEFKTIAELYNSLPQEQRNIEIYKKLAYLDYYYRTSYAGEIDEENLVYMVANGYIIGTGDKFGGYYTADEFKTVMDDAEGSSVGIGVYVTADADTENIRISYVMKDGPANKAGLLPGDVVTHVEGKSISELGYYTAIDAIKGEEGTPVEITYVRNGESYNATLIRAAITVESVIYTRHETEPNVGIIRIIEFNNSTPQQFYDAVERAIKVDGCNKLVYDLRGNPGGTLTLLWKCWTFCCQAALLLLSAMQTVQSKPTHLTKAEASLRLFTEPILKWRF